LHGPVFCGKMGARGYAGALPRVPLKERKGYDRGAAPITLPEGMIPSGLLNFLGMVLFVNVYVTLLGDVEQPDEGR